MSCLEESWCFEKSIRNLRCIKAGFKIEGGTTIKGSFTKVYLLGRCFC